jgi:RNA polymerase sigma factor (sigma-70 family)
LWQITSAGSRAGSAQVRPARSNPAVASCSCRSIRAERWSTCGAQTHRLYRIASNAIADRAKRKLRESSDQPNPVSEISTAPDLEEVERRARLFSAVDKLPEDQRRVIVMRFAEEKSIHEIAGELGRSEGAVKQLQFRGIENLRNRLNEK